MPDVPVAKCGLCGSKKTYSIGHPKHRRRCCLDCKAQQDGDNWYTLREWDILNTCGCCRFRPNECEGCKDFDKWKTDNMERESMPKGWLPPFYRKEFRCKLPETDDSYWSEWLPMSKYKADPDCEYEFR